MSVDRVFMKGNFANGTTISEEFVLIGGVAAKIRGGY